MEVAGIACRGSLQQGLVLVLVRALDLGQLALVLVLGSARSPPLVYYPAYTLALVLQPGPKPPPTLPSTHQN